MIQAVHIAAEVATAAEATTVMGEVRSNQVLDVVSAESARPALIRIVVASSCGSMNDNHRQTRRWLVSLKRQ